VGQERLGPSYFFIPLVLGPLNSRACLAKEHGSLSPQNLYRSAPRFSSRPRVEALVACGAHQIHSQGSQGTCTREMGGRESGRGRERERACVPVPLSSCETEEGAHAHFSSKKAAFNHAPSVAILLAIPVPFPKGDPCVERFL
jgi:hypothetical protein